MAAADMPVPPGFHITTDAYRRYVEENHLGDRILSAATHTQVNDPAALVRGPTGIVPQRWCDQARLGQNRSKSGASSDNFPIPVTMHGKSPPFGREQLCAIHGSGLITT
jgi:hypothetical protein